MLKAAASRRAVTRSRPCLVFVLAFAGLVLAQHPTFAQACPNPPVVDIRSSSVPSDVCVPANFPGNPIAFFDDFSWKSFVALAWPADSSQRGKPDATKNVAGAGPKVFETYKALWEVFHTDGSKPTAWNKPDAMNACSVSPGMGDLVLASFSKFSDLGQAGFGSLVGPLVAQNTTYVRYLTAFNELEFDQIVNQGLYLRSQLPVSPKTLTFENGSIDVKSAWIDMTHIPHPERYYTRTALVLNVADGTCAKTTVGLVGLHIVQKTAHRPQWIWSTFEQVDNVPPAQPGAQGNFTFNDGTSAPMPAANPYSISPLKLPVPPPFNVNRLKPIHSSTQATNPLYQKALHDQGSVWQFYELVMTQWPVKADDSSLPGTPANTFPGTGSDSTSFSNTTLETFDQMNIRTGCMNCHTQTMAATDFVWSVADHAFPPNVPSLLMKNSSFRELRTLMELNTQKASDSASPK
jgi:hypothetical protein